MWGHPLEYRFRIDHPDGKCTVVERATDAVRVQPELAEYQRRMLMQSMRRQNPDFDWESSGMPTTLPWYQLFVADQQNRIWVSRTGEYTQVEDCTQPEDVVQGQRSTPCWEPTRLLEAFDIDGNFLSGLDRPRGLVMVGPYIRGDIIVAGYEDELGVSKVRVYRIVLPGAHAAVTEAVGG